MIADLDAISQVGSIASYNRLIGRLVGDNRELTGANNDLHGKLR